VRLICFWFTRSKSLPGVATSISTHLRSILTWLPCLTPPNITVVLRLVLREYLRRFSPICIASSLVGVMMSERIHTRSLRPSLSSCVLSSSCNMGSENDAVLPVPVCAQPKISFPSSATGIDCSWIGVGVWYHSASSTSKNFWANHKSLKVVIRWILINKPPNPLNRGDSINSMIIEISKIHMPPIKGRGVLCIQNKNLGCELYLDFRVLDWV